MASHDAGPLAKRIAKKMARGREIMAPAPDDSPRLFFLRAIGETDGEMGIIMADRLTADEDGVAFMAELVGDFAGSGAGNPPVVAAAGRDFSVEAEGDFRRNPRAAGHDPMIEGAVEMAAFIGKKTVHNLDTRVLQ